MAVRCKIFTPLGEFVVAFENIEAAYAEIGQNTVFTGPIGQVIIIPADIQKKSVFYITQE